MRTIYLLLLLVSYATAAEPNRNVNLVILDETSVKNLKLETVVAEERDFEETVFVLGEIGIYPGSKFVVSSRIPGRALTVTAEPDMPVSTGADLITVESRQPGEPPPTISLKAPGSGLIAKINVAPGQPISPDEALIEIVNIEKVHATAHVPEHLVGKMAMGRTAKVTVPSFPDRSFEAKLEHIGALADAESGTLEAVFHIDNPELLLRPGMRAEFLIEVGSRKNVMSIPTDAVQGDAANPFVFVADYELNMLL